MNGQLNRWLLAGLMFLLTASAAMAAKTTKTNEWVGVSGNWADAANWSRGHIPEADEYAWFNPAQAVEVTVNGEYATGTFGVGVGSKSASITFKGTGKVTLGGYSPSPYIRANHPITLDGVTLDAGNA